MNRKQTVLVLLSLLLSCLMMTMEASARSRVRVIYRPWWPRAIVVRPAPILRRPIPRPVDVTFLEGYLSFDIQPLDADVYIDSVYQGIAVNLSSSAEYLSLPRGIHLISISRDGYRTEQFRLNVHDNQVTELSVSLRLLTEEPGTADLGDEVYQVDMEKTGSVSFTIIPKDAVIFIDNAFYGSLSQFNGPNEELFLREGMHKLDITRPGYMDYSASFVVKESTPQKIDITMQKKTEADQ